MSFTNLRYDNCDYKYQLKQSMTPLQYHLDPVKFENSMPCRIELGIVGGNNVSLPRGNLVDVESELRGITRVASRCPEYLYNNPCSQENGSNLLTCQDNRKFSNRDCTTIDYSKVHLSPCMITKPPRPTLPEQFNPGSCGCGDNNKINS